MRILSVEECENINYYLNSFKEHVEEYCSDIESSINVFNSNEVVQSFYASGGFGKDMEARLEEVRIAVKKYYEIISSDGGLIPATKTLVSKQREILEKRNSGGA